MTREAKHQALLDRAVAGDGVALEGLLLAVRPQLYRFSLRMCRDREDAADVLQESMLALARSVRQIREGSALGTWLFTVVRRFCIKNRRKRAGAPTHEHSLEALAGRDATEPRAPQPDPEEATATAQTWERVASAIERLEPDHREVLLLRDVEGLSAKQVSEVVGISVAAVKSRLHRARAALRESLAEATATFAAAGCPAIRTVFSRYLEGELSADVCAVMQQHVDGCSLCAAECDQLKAVLLTCNTAPAPVPPDVDERLRGAIQAALDQK